MKTFTNEELQEILTKHKLWLNGEDGGERANLRYANLRYADLRSADLRYADLRYADLHSADLRYADLRYADLRYADLHSADLNELKIDFPMACPDTGSFIGWKKTRDDFIVKLEIPETAQRSSATGRKCRCDTAKVLEIQNLDGTPADVEYAVSIHDSDFKYIVGETVSVPDFLPNRWLECAAGIHFFINRIEAVNYDN